MSSTNMIIISHRAKVTVFAAAVEFCRSQSRQITASFFKAAEILFLPTQATAPDKVYKCLVFSYFLEGGHIKCREFPIILLFVCHIVNSLVPAKFSWYPSEVYCRFKLHESSVRSCSFYIYKENMACSLKK